MRIVWSSALARLAVLVLVAMPPAASSRPYTVDDLVRTEAFGRILVAPGGRWLLFERRGGRDDAPYFDERAMEVLRSHLYRVDLAHPGPAVPLLPAGEDGGTIVLGFSPAGTRAAIARLTRDRWTLGVVTLATAAVRWFDLAPDYYPYRTTLGWASETHLLVIAQPKGGLPYVLRADRRDIARLEEAWARKSEGRTPTVTAVGSGAYLSATPPPTETRLVDLDAMTGVERSLARGVLQSVTVAPDGRHVALVAETDAIRIRSKALISTGAELRHRGLSIIDIASGQSWSPCDACDVQYRPPSWAPSGNALLFFARKAGQEWAQGRVWRADLSSATSAPLPGPIQATVRTPFGDYSAASFGWSGAAPLVFGRPDDGMRDDWYRLDPDGPHNLTKALATSSPSLVEQAGRSPVMLAGTAWQLGRTGATRRWRELSRVERLPVAIMGTTEAAGLFGWRPTDDGIVADPGNGHFVRIAAADDVRPVTASAAMGTIVGIATDGHGRAALTVYRRGAPPIAVARINGHLADVDDPPPTPLHHRLPDGQMVTSWLCQPRGSASGRPAPLIVIPYAGTAYGGEPPRGFRSGDGPPFTNVAVLRDHGYAVLMPSMPALPGSDQAPDLAGQVLSAVDAAIATGTVDGKRLGLWGHSYGGYTVALIATQTDRFGAVVASNGIYDLATFPGSFTPQTRLEPGDYQSMLGLSGWAETGQPRLGGPAWSVPSHYVGSSPLYRADRIVTPMLIVAGERDFVPLQQAEQLFSALYRQGKDAVLLSYWGEEHNMSSPANLRDSYRRILDWLDRHLAGIGS
ncbi:S9 family peptidase [Sphingomonas sp. AP4-R1]|uniref:alpha/beta hydrolase family protein n=1 Tax=Sphingomonas sp. AP4-R1 TaxID=2735134 RepID=UPI00149339F4|nr:prolyl oligopeptidase family serine peptidase [Sphingomonas sp. AP4-R1]QJU60280.1 S9 family peptidase [Sphingomonas sp. AP4-R1]